MPSRRVLVRTAGLLAPTVAFGSVLGNGARAADRTIDLYLARHGQTDWNLAKRIQGSTDNPLNAKGREQAAALGAALSGLEPARIVTSALVRTRETAELAFPGRPIEPLAGLNERSFGRFEGLDEGKASTEELEAFKRRSADPEDSLDGGESIASQSARVSRTVRELLASTAEGPIVIVSHGGVTPLILGGLLGLGPVEATARIRQANDEVYLVRLAGERVLSLWKLVPLGRLEDL